MEAGDFSSQRRTSAAFARGISASEHEHGISLKQQRKAAVPALKRSADLFDAAVRTGEHCLLSDSDKDVYFLTFCAKLSVHNIPRFSEIERAGNHIYEIVYHLNYFR